MKPIQTTVSINAPIHKVFDCLAALDRYDWLATSDTYQRTEILTELPIRQGTRYRDAGTQINMTGELSTFNPPHQLIFAQSSEIKLLGVTNRMNLLIQYHLQGDENSTTLTRDQSVELGGILPLLSLYLRYIMQKENKRILQTLKAHLETD
jgi:uncharacterized protein YndB with AHSA1/START domain